MLSSGFGATCTPTANNPCLRHLAVSPSIPAPELHATVTIRSGLAAHPSRAARALTLAHSDWSGGVTSGGFIANKILDSGCSARARGSAGCCVGASASGACVSSSAASGQASVSPSVTSVGRSPCVGHSTASTGSSVECPSAPSTCSCTGSWVAYHCN